MKDAARTRARIAGSLCFAAVLACADASAQNATSTQNLRQSCEAAEQMILTARSQPQAEKILVMGFTCLGYLRGYLEGLVQAQAAGSAKRIYCPENAKDLKVADFRQWAAAFVKFADAHPDRARANAADTLAALVAQVAPCKP